MTRLLAGLAFTLLLALSACADVDRLGDELPPGAIQRLGSLRLVPSGGVTDFAHVPGDRLVSVAGHYLDIWDLATGQRLSRVRARDASLQSVALRAEGDALLLTDSAGMIREWSLADARELRSWPSGQETLSAAVYTPDQTKVVSMGHLPPTLRVWDVASGTLLREIRGGLGYFSAVVCLLDNRRVWVGGGHSPILEQYDLETGECLVRAFEDYTVYDMTLSLDGKRLLVGSRHRASERDAETGEELHVYSGHHGHAAPSVAYSADPARLLTGSRDGSIRIWERGAAEFARRWVAHQGHVSRMRVSPDGRWVVSYGAGLLAQSDAATGEPRIAWERHSGAVTAAAFGPTGTRIVSVSSDGTLRLWDARTGESLLLVESIGLGTYAVAVSPDGTRAAAGCKDGAVREYDLATGRVLRELAAHRGYVRGVAYSPDAARLLSCADDGSAVVWPPEGAEPLTRLVGHRGGVLAVCVSPDARSVATAGRDGTVRVWDIASGSVSVTLRAHRGWVERVSFAADGRAVSGGRDGRVVVWDVAAGKPIRELRHGEWVKALAVSADGSRAWSAGDSGEVVEWNLEMGAEVRRRPGPQGGVVARALSPHAGLFAARCPRPAHLVWDLARPVP